jgi:2-methylcitrate dehydratase PrpD
MENIEQDTIMTLVTNVLKTAFEDIDVDSAKWAKTRVMDIIGCMVVGSNAPGNYGLIKTINQWGGRPEATVLVHGIKVPMANAAMVNSIMARSFDFGAVHPVVDNKGIPGHVSETIVPTALTIAEAVNTNGKELLVSMIAGEDLACRILAASGFNLDQGWDCIGTVNAFGATAVAGRLLGLTEEQMQNAFGLVLNQLAGTLQNIWDSATSFKLIQGLAARNGVFSAELAKAGWTGCKDPLFSRYGYFKLYTSGCIDRKILTKELGKTFYSDSCIKPYPCCRGTHSSIDCAFKILKKHPIKVEEIEKIEVLLPTGGLNSFVARPFILGSFVQADALFSLRYTVANVLIRKGIKPEHFSEKAIRDPQVKTLAESMVLRESSEIPRLGAAVRIGLSNGLDVIEHNDVPKGDRFHNPLSGEEIESKFRQNLHPIITEKNQTRLLEMLDNLESLDNVKGIAKLLNQKRIHPGAKKR